MGPKPNKQAGNKAIQKQKEKIIEDKTFGLKNKKGAKQQRFIQQVEVNVLRQQAGKSAKDIARLQKEKDQKLQKDAENEELKTLFKPVVDQKAVPKGVDPKSIVCAFHKQGICMKGNKCKFSHDLTKMRQTEKKCIYTDIRDLNKEGETMENWNESELKEVVSKKHGEANKLNATSKICKYFLEAVEKQTYGWFWDCPNGNDKCMYRHCLPEGYVLKRDKQAAEVKDESMSIEDLIESQREKLFQTSKDKLTKITLETFLIWKKQKLTEKNKKSSESSLKKKTEFSQGLTTSLTGKDLFDFNPLLASDQNKTSEDDKDNSDDDVDYYNREDEDEYQGFINDIDLNSFTEGAFDEALFLNDEDTKVDDITKETSSLNING
ncbi:hypothetical protein GJ496_009226 [Pomphorhynchus laevis]|nr:hypothetical protein GJ496_009226 [Pomphorhynchus laevis]